MLKELALRYYLTENYNCAEAVLKAADEAYRLNLGETGLKLAGGFGGGLGCGSACGALVGALAAYGALAVRGKAKETPGFKEQCASLCAKFAEQTGFLNCAELSPLYKDGAGRCQKPIEAAAALLEEAAEVLAACQGSVAAQ